ncbi:MAG: phosphotransferase [Chloroflexi bacterium]|nr:phosphotransferase [Chloroflexota bacterium]
MQSGHIASIDLNALEPEVVATFLTNRLGADVDPRSVQRVGHGEWSTTFTFESPRGRDLVVRFSVRNDDFLKDQHAMHFASSQLPIPKLLEIGPVTDGYYAISERAYGEFVEDRDQAAMQRLLPSLFDMLDACRGVDLSTTTGFGIWRGDATAPHASWRDALLSVASDAPTNRTHGWRTKLRQSEVGQRAFDRAFQRLQASVDACPSHERYLVHSDLLYFNVLVRDDHISAVLDWGSSMYGDFLWDLAWLTFWQPWYPTWSGLDLRLAARQHYAAIGLEVPNFEERMRCYELAIGLDGLAYQSFAGHWDNLAWTAQRLLGLIG